MSVPGATIMMDPAFKEVISKLGQTVDSINRNFINLNLNTLIEPYNGSQPSKLRSWISAVEKVADATGMGEHEKMISLYLTARDHVSDYMRRWYSENSENLKFEELKKSLISNFSSVTEPSMAHDMLRRIRQKPDESVTIFAERIYNLAEHAFADLTSRHAAAQGVIQQQLVDYFVSGLLSKHLKFKILSKRCTTLKDAVKVAREENELIRKYNAHGGVKQFEPNPWKGDKNPDESPMEVERVRRRNGPCSFCGSHTHSIKDCFKRQNRNKVLINEINKENEGGNNRMRKDERTCWVCGLKGHIQYQCKKRQGSTDKKRTNHLN